MQTNKTIYNVRASVVRAQSFDKTDDTVRVMPSLQGWDGYSDAVTLQPGERLTIIQSGGADRWSQAIIVSELPAAPPQACPCADHNDRANRRTFPLCHD